MIRLEELSVEAGDFTLRDISLEVAEGEFFVVMGPTGAGKTMLLESIAGLISPLSGRIIVDERDITGLSPEERGITIVYQDCSLFPHLSVLDNIRYGLRYHRTAMSRWHLDDLISVLDLESLLDRYPPSLSGGESQRVALARALAVKPSILLLDEPLNALDPAFRGEIQTMLKRLHNQTGITFLMVTHDFNEALALARCGAVLNQGRIEQAGEIEDLFKKPRSKFVATFVGIRNLFRAEFRETRARVNGLSIETGRRLDQSDGYLAIRPEDIVLSRHQIASSMRNSFSGEIIAIERRGMFYEVTVQCGELILRSLITRGALEELELTLGKMICFSFKATAVHTF
ncbi:MAG: ABC transporter ATP-binding protein [Candidatus Euphemobacter frigidus]|nr:ABC transporter ATP-binding protein [Candidatus Euphemobacter frigidus]MDP8274969.1 ABC transporter ATP-binding protein [Candidatus Euphemobacter frigidus]